MNLDKTEQHVARYWITHDNGTIQCQLCPRQCVLADQERGFCFARQNINGKLILTSYGLVSGLCVDPIEKKPLYHFYPGSSVLSFGTIGCNLGCQFCQNWEISKPTTTARLTQHAAPDMIAHMAKKAFCQSVAFTYNDPAVFMEYAMDTAAACHKEGVKTVAVTAGYMNAQPRQDFFKHIDAVNVDLKSFSDDFYKKFSAARLQPVLDTLTHIKHHTNTWLEITTLLIPGENDSYAEIRDMSQWIARELGPDVPLHFSAFFPTFKLTDHDRTPAERLFRARDIALKAGIRHVYTGNIHHPESAATYCSNCQKMIISRNQYEIIEYHLNSEAGCKYCAAKCAGHF